ncbi:MAG: hypothetical protein K1X95_07590 [Acidimicrobiia bacterium]|nr:hypothetical protein [Acidimicrobiia bacterium]
MQPPTTPGRAALRLGVMAAGLAAVLLVGAHAAHAAETADVAAQVTTSDSAPKAAATELQQRSHRLRAAPDKARPEPRATPGPVATGPVPTAALARPHTDSESSTSGPAETEAPEPVQTRITTPATENSAPAAQATDAVASTAAIAGPVVTADAPSCGGDCATDMRTWVTGRSYDPGTDTWAITTVADVFSEVGCYVTPVCVVRIDTDGAPVQGPPPVLACALGWAATGDGGCRKSDGTATGSGFEATVVTSPGAPAYFQLPFVLTWEHLDIQLPVASSANPVFLDAPVTVVGDCPRATEAGTTFTCTLHVQVPPGTAPPATMYFFGGGDPDRPDLIPVSLTTTDPNWTCAGTFCQTSSPVAGAWTDFVSTATTLASARGGHAVVWGATAVIPPPSGNPFGYALGIYVTAADDADVPIDLVPPAAVHPGTPATVVVTFTNRGASAAVDPFFVVGVLADLAAKSFTAETPPGWSCRTGTPDDSGDDGPFVMCSGEGSSLAAGASATVRFTFTLPYGYDTTVPVPFIAYSQWGPGTDNVRPHHFATAVAAATPAAEPQPEPATEPAPSDPHEVIEVVAARATAASVAGLPSTGTDPAGLLGIGTALLAAGTTLNRRSRRPR